MKVKLAVFYGSMALNVVLLVLVAWPRHEANLAFGQAGVTVGTFAGASTKESDNQESTWIADRATGTLLVFDYDATGKGNAVVRANRDLKADLEENQVGNLMLIPAQATDTRGAMYLVDTESQRMIVYEYNGSNKTITPQQVDLANFLRRPAPAANAGG